MILVFQLLGLVVGALVEQLQFGLLFFRPYHSVIMIEARTQHVRAVECDANARVDGAAMQLIQQLVGVQRFLLHFPCNNLCVSLC